MRAAAEDIVAAQLLGVKINTVVASAFAISGLLAGIVSVLFIGQMGLVGPTVGVARHRRPAWMDRPAARQGLPNL